MNLQLEGTVALVTGASRGIGKAVAECFLSEGGSVTIVARDSPDLRQAEIALARDFGDDRVHAISADVATEAGAIEAVDAVWSRWRRLDSLVLNVGSGRGTPGPLPGSAEWARLLEVNLASTTLVAEAALPHMFDAGAGAVTVVGSIAGLETVGAPLPYEAAKAALVAYVSGLARLVGSSGIRVNCVAPGNILHPGSTWERALAERPDDVALMLERDVPLGRFGSPQEVANLVVFLSSGAAAYVTGSVFVVDGGQTRGA